MARRIKALVKPGLLAWARRSINLSVHEAALRAKVDEAELAAWEADEDAPTVPQLRKLAHVYKRPLAVFFLPKAPKDFDAMKYFRRHPRTPEVRPSPELTYAIRQVELQRDTALELARSTGGEPKPLSVRARVSDGAAAWAAKVREMLGVTLSDQMSWKDENEAWRSWRAALEGLDVLVFQVPGISVEEMRGFSLVTEQLPVIAVNSGEFVRARMFTALHEFGHVLLGTGDLDTAKAFWIADDEVEAFCNELAGQVLVPHEALDQLTTLRPGARDDAAAGAEVVRLANRLRVSQDVVLRRLLRTRRVSQRFFDAHRDMLARVRPKKPKPAPIPVQVKVLSRFGRPYVLTVIEALRSERITMSDVSDYLGVQVKFLPRIERAAYGYDAQ